MTATAALDFHGASSLEGFLALGFLVGMQHALEADHLAAVGTMLSDGRSSARRLALRGAAWGLGHTITLFSICGAVIVLGLTLSDRLGASLEFAVGLLLVWLGVDVLRKMRARRVHFHAHQHDDGRLHLHAHSHLGEPAASGQPHADNPHQHKHPRGLPLKALLIGLMHGAAGSAGLIALTVAATGDPLVAVGYVALFGLGSMLGMAALSFAAAIPLGLYERQAQLLHAAVGLAAGLVAIGLGISIIGEMAPLAFDLG